MRTIIAGSRDFTDYDKVKEVMEKLSWEPTVILGGIGGAARLGEKWARENNVPIEKHPANWGSYGMAAGYIRDEYMAKHADALVAFWDGNSRGTANMIKLAKKYKLKLYVCAYY